MQVHNAADSTDYSAVAASILPGAFEVALLLLKPAFFSLSVAKAYAPLLLHSVNSSCTLLVGRSKPVRDLRVS